MTQHFDVAVIGGGIVGLAHAWMAARRRLRVAVFERSPAAEGASILNFGMIWPIGQPAGERYALAIRARELWLELGAHGVVDVESCGSIHLAHRDDELAVLTEFCERETHAAQLITPREIAARSPLANSEGLRGGMWSESELRVDPRVASARIARWLDDAFGVAMHFNTAITRVADRRLESTDGRRWKADRIVVCSGSDLQTLYADVLQDASLVPCKLQMLKIAGPPQPVDRRPHLASGLTLRHYTSFEDCPSHAALRERIARETPELDRFGIHVMASPLSDGRIILGDSHEYGSDITPFDKPEIDELMLRELRKVIRLEDWAIRERWHGIYAKHLALPVFETLTEDGVHIFVGTGGAGMTLSFGLAERAWKRWTGDAA